MTVGRSNLLSRRLVLIGLAQAIPASTALAAGLQAAVTPDPGVDSTADEALHRLMSNRWAARAARAARAVLTFPELDPAGEVTAGKGVLRRAGGPPLGYYAWQSPASDGPEDGGWFACSLMIMTDAALASVQRTTRWQIGAAGPHVDVVTPDNAEQLSRAERAEVYAFVHREKDLLGGVSLSGTVLTQFA